LLEIRMWSIIREIFVAVCFLSLLFALIYTRQTASAFYHQMNHLRLSLGNALSEVTTINDYWNWLQVRFLPSMRAQAWYNGAMPRHLSGFLNDRTSRLIGWPIMRQVRVRSDLCTYAHLQSTCYDDYQWWREETRSFAPGWLNHTQTNQSSVERAFAYRAADTLDSYGMLGDHGSYPSSGYIYEFRGRLNEIRENLSVLHQSQWIDQATRAVILQLNLYNPNAQLFTSVVILAEFLNTGSVHSTMRIEPIHVYGLRHLSSYQPSYSWFISCRDSVAVSTDRWSCVHDLDCVLHDRRNPFVDQAEDEVFPSFLVVGRCRSSDLCMGVRGYLCLAIHRDSTYQ
jgi:hypothetical protein